MAAQAGCRQKESESGSQLKAAAAVLLFSLFVFLAGGKAVQANEFGIAWLLTQQQEDGRIAGIADETNAHHATYESFRTLHLLGHEAGAAIDAALYYLDSDPAPGLANLSRRLIVAAVKGGPVDELVTELVRHQNPDGGFSARPGERSSVLDTIEALEPIATPD